jgi:hypothetical protein
MKFTVELEYVSGYIRTGQLVGEMTPEQYAEWSTLSEAEQQEMLWDLGHVEVTDYRIEDVGDIESVEWSNYENT